MTNGEVLGREEQQSIGQRWYAVQAQPGREHVALQQLAHQNFEIFCPMRSKLLRIGKRKIESQTPFFPGYLFARLDLEREQWRSINGTRGVIRIVSFGVQPAALPCGFVDKLKDLGGPLAHAAREDLQPGASVRIVGGPFNELCGTLVEASDKDRVTILLRILAGETKVQLSRDFLAAA